MENCSEYYCLSIILNISSFSPLNNNVNTTLKHYRKPALSKKLKVDRKGHTILYEKATGP